MDLSEYQYQCRQTAIYPDYGAYTERSLNYVTLKLNGEAGEFAEKVGKRMRDGLAGLSEEEWKKLAAKELGDVLWYVAMAAWELGYSLDQVANLNLNKLRERKESGKLSGSGDER